MHCPLCICRWALYDISRHPKVQKRIAQELADAGLLQVSLFAERLGREGSAGLLQRCAQGGSQCEGQK